VEDDVECPDEIRGLALNLLENEWHCIASHVHDTGEGRMGGDGTDRRQESGVALPLCKVSAKEFAVIGLFHVV